MSQPAPTIVGTLVFPLAQSVLHSCRPGPYLHGTDRWIVSVEIADSVSLPNLVAYKSTDGGATYTRIVAGPSTTLIPVFIAEAAAYVYYRGSGTVIDIGYQAPDLSLNAIAFDMASATFGPVNPTGFTIPIGPSGVGLTNLAMVTQPGGDLVMVYSQYGLSLLAITYQGSPLTWHGPGEIDTGETMSPPVPNYYFENVVVDGAGNVGILYEQGSNVAFRFGNKLYARFDGTTVLSRTATPLAASADTGVWCAPIYDSTSDSVVFPTSRTILVGVDNLPAVSLLIGTPAAAPVFTAVTVKLYGLLDLASGGDVMDFVNIIGNSAGNHFAVFWFARLSNDLHWTVQQSSAPALTGPWAVPSLYYDENTAQPTPSPFLVRLAPVFSNTLADGSVGTIVGLVTISPFGFGVLYTWAPGAAPPVTSATITAVQVITGGAGTPTKVTATGPTIKSGTGGFSATMVAVGTYVLTQNPVPGFPAGPWVLSGSGGTLVGNILTVANGANVTVTITNTFVPGMLSVGCLASPGILNAPFDETVPVSGGTPPYTFSITSGSLPPGLSLDAATGDISGIPVSEGTFPYTIQVKDSA